MSQVRVRQPKQTRVTPQEVTEQAVQKQLAWAVGAEQFQHRDPLFHVTESFQQTFEKLGKTHVEKTEDGAAQSADPADMSDHYQRRDPAQQELLARFSETAFQRGTLSGAVLRGTGQMMLFSCLKRTVGQSQPMRMQQAKLFEGVSRHRAVPGHGPDKVIFNQGFTDSAVALVVDTLRDARRTVESMAELASGESVMGAGSGAETLQKMYPFLSDSKERGLLEQYRASLGQATDAGQQQVLHSAAVRTQALIEKKSQMKAEFISKLRFFSQRANQALADFEEPGFAASLYAAVELALEPEVFLPDPNEPTKPPEPSNPPKSPPDAEKRGEPLDGADPADPAAHADPGGDPG